MSTCPTSMACRKSSDGPGWLTIARTCVFVRLAAADPHYAILSIIEALEQLKDEFRCMLLRGSRPCPFLDGNKCSTDPTNPNDCIATQAGDEQCQAPRQAEGLSPLAPVAESILSERPKASRSQNTGWRRLTSTIPPHYPWDVTSGTSAANRTCRTSG